MVLYHSVHMVEALSLETIQDRVGHNHTRNVSNDILLFMNVNLKDLLTMLNDLGVAIH